MPIEMQDLLLNREGMEIGGQPAIVPQFPPKFHGHPSTDEQNLPPKKGDSAYLYIASTKIWASHFLEVFFFLLAHTPSRALDY